MRGGKLIQYHGLADGGIPTGSSIVFYNRLVQSLSFSMNLTDHYRFFLIPGMQHCCVSVNDAPYIIGGASQSLLLTPNTTHSVPGFSSADHDALLDFAPNNYSIDRPDTATMIYFHASEYTPRVDVQLVSREEWQLHQSTRRQGSHSNNCISSYSLSGRGDR